jgi:hypothetical protein
LRALVYSFLFLFCINFNQHSFAARKAISLDENQAIISVLVAYEELHAHFFDYNKEKLEASAQKLKATVDNLQDQNLKKTLSEVSNKASLIKSNARRPDNNQAMNSLSFTLIKYLKNNEVKAPYNAYLCPMTKLRWIQNSKKLPSVSNPYSPEMPNCGRAETDF